MITRAALIVLAFFLTGFSHACAEDDPPSTFVGRVVRISDGDTVTVLVESEGKKEMHRIRLKGIDSPEKGQTFGTKPKSAFGDKVFDKKVRVEWTRRDRNERIIGDIFLGDRWINLEMVEEGWAWHFKRYSKDQALADAEISARKDHRGLWQDPDPIPPWDYRKATTAAKPRQKAQKGE